MESVEGGARHDAWLPWGVLAIPHLAITGMTSLGRLSPGSATVALRTRSFLGCRRGFLLPVADTVRCDL